MKKNPFYGISAAAMLFGCYLRGAPDLATGPTPESARPVSGKEELVRQIAEAEALLSRLEAERTQTRARLAALRAELASQETSETAVRVPVPATSPPPVPGSAAEKVRLFRGLFRGRTDVFPTRFVSKKTGKTGYAPACTNKFVPGVCELPKCLSRHRPRSPGRPQRHGESGREDHPSTLRCRL